MHSLTASAHSLSQTLLPHGPRAEALVATTARLLSLLIAAAVAVTVLHLQAPQGLLTL